MESQRSHSSGSRAESWIALALCAAVLVAGVLEQLVRDRPAYAEAFAPDWLPLAAAGLAAAGIIVRFNGRPRLPRLGRALSWGGLLLLVWTASGLPLDLLRVTSLIVPGLMPPGVDWPGLATRALALAAVVVLARLRPGAPGRPRVHPRPRVRPPGQLVRLRRLRARAALPGPQDVVGAGRDASGSGGRERTAWPARSPCGCPPSRGCWRPPCPCSSCRRRAGCRAGCCWSQAGPPPSSSP